MIQQNSFGKIPIDWPPFIFYRNPRNRLCFITLLITIWTSHLTGAISSTFTIVSSAVYFILQKFKFRFPLTSLASQTASSTFCQPFLVTSLPNNSVSNSRVTFLINLLWPPGTVQIHTFCPTKTRRIRQKSKLQSQKLKKIILKIPSPTPISSPFFPPSRHRHSTSISRRGHIRARDPLHKIPSAPESKNLHRHHKTIP